MPKINEALIRRQCIREHGEIMGSVLVEVQLTAIRKHAAEYDEMERQVVETNAELSAINARVPSLEPLRQAMGESYQLWLAACEALETQRLKNEAAGGPARNRLSEVRQRMTEHLASTRPDGWAKSDLVQKDVYQETLVDQGFRRQINAESRQ